MKNFLRILGGNITKKREEEAIKSYCNRDYERAKNSIGMIVIAKLLKEINNAVAKQPSLKNDITVLAEKVISKIDIKTVVVQNESSCQMLNDEYFHCLHMNGLWEMLLNHFVDFTLCVTEREFRDVAYLLMLHLNENSNEEKEIIAKVADNYINLREDGRFEIIFPGKTWGSQEVVENMINNAEKAGICFVDINSSPISRKAILPHGWNFLVKKDFEGYTLILDDLGRQRGEFRITKLPSYSDNGEFDFFFYDSPVQILDGTSQKLLNSNERNLISNS